MSIAEIETLSSKTLHRSRWIGIIEDQVRFADGSTGAFTTIDKPDYAAIVPLDADGHVYLVEQYRYAIRRRSLEIPMGASEDAGDTDLQQVAHKELREETGLIAAEMRAVGSFVSAGGYMRQRGHAYVARGLTQGPRALETAEQGLTVHRFALADVIAMMRNGHIDNVATIAAIGLAQLHDAL